MQYNWNVKSLYKSINDPQLKKDQERYIDVIKKFATKWEKDSSYLEKEERLIEALTEYNEIIEDYTYGGKPGIYVFLQSSLHEDDDKVRGVYTKHINILQNASNEILFFSNRLSKIDPKKQKEYLKSKKLKQYKTLLRRLFDKSKHLLSEPEEKIINLMSKTSYSNWIDMTSNLLSKSVAEVIDEDGKKVKKNFSEVVGLMDSMNKKTRESAAAEFSRINSQYADVATFELNSILEIKKTEDQLRGFKRADESSLAGDDVDVAYVDNLIKAVTKGFNLSERFYKLKSKLLKQKSLKYSERNRPIGRFDKEFKADHTIELISKVLTNLDPSFGSIFNSMLEHGHVDFYPAIGKSGGAFCMPTGKNGDIYVLLNHNNRLRDVTTFAHEMGHAIHYHYAKEQMGLYCNASLATAEVASTFMEDFVLKELLKEVDDEGKLSIIMEKLNDEVSTIHRQIACYKFEQDLHIEFAKTGFLSKNDIGEIFKKNMTSYMGDYVIFEKENYDWWVYWSHIRRYFYVYSYASGLLISKALQYNYNKDNSFIEKVKKFLAAGDSDSPVEIFNSIGIDTTNPSIWSNGIKQMEELLEEAESLSVKLG